LTFFQAFFNFCFDAVSTELMPTILVLVEYNPTTTEKLVICQFYKKLINDNYSSVWRQLEFPDISQRQLLWRPQEAG